MASGCSLEAHGISQPEHAERTSEELLAQRAAPAAPSPPQERPAMLLGHAGMLQSQGSLIKQVPQQVQQQLQEQGALDRAPSDGMEPPQRKRPREAQALGPAGALAEVQPRKRQTRTDLDKQLKSWDDIDLEQLEATSSEEEVEVVPQRGRLRAPPQEVLTAPGAVAASRLETETAWAVMVNAGSSITDEEEDLLPEGASEKIYVQVRNMVLTRWRQDVTQYLTLAQGISAAPPHLHQYASAAWRFLDAAGYINFGLAADITAQREKKRSQPLRGSVIVVGAGLSGLVTARQLQNKGYKVLVLEGHDRPGGRVYTKRLEGHGVSCVADLGGSIITGIDGNPLTVLAKQLRIPLHEINSTDVMLYMAEGLQADQKLDDEVEKKMNQLLDECSRFRDEMGEVSDYITLGTALETIWSGIAGSAAAKRVPRKGKRPSSADPEQPVKVDLASEQPAPSDGGRYRSDQHTAQQVVRELVDRAVASERLPDSQVKQEDLPAVQQEGNSYSDSLRPSSQAKQEDLLAPKQEGLVGSSSLQPPSEDEQQQLPVHDQGEQGGLGSVKPLSQAWQQQLPIAKQEGTTGSVSVKAPTKAEQQGRLKRRLLDWHMANLEFANATTLHKLSMRSWDQDDPYEVQGSHCFLPGCNLRIVAGLVEGLPVLYNHVVTAVEYSQEGCLVTSGNKQFKADAVVISVPLGVLKKEVIAFQPPLPQRKQTAIRQLGFGVLNKVILLFPHVFWGDNVDMFGRVAESTTERGEFFLFYSYAHISGGPCLTALVAGEAAERFEEQDSAESVAKVMAALRTIFAPKKIQVPPPVQAVCTRWGKDPMACGSYSSVGVGSLGGEDYDIMAESVGDRLFFAGEHTTRKYPATMHGAFFTGLREAANVDATLSSRSAALHREERRLAALAASAALAAKRAELGALLSVDPGWAAEPERREPSPQAAENTAKAIELADQLVQLFDDPKHPPDEEFGCCALVKGPAGTTFAGEALVRLDIGAVKGKGGLRRSMPIYLTLRTADAMRLQDLPGGDGARVAFLTSLGVQMVGRHGIDDNQQHFVEAVLQQRHGRRRSPVTHAGGRLHGAASPQQQHPPGQPQHRLLSRGAAGDGRVQPTGSFRRAGSAMDQPSPASKPQDWSHFYAGE